MPGTYSQESLEAHFETINQRLRRIEEHLVLLTRTAGVDYAPSWAGVPDEVIELAQAGKQMEAVKRYRELTGANFDQARDVVVGL